jgi:hypothetical protein
VEELEKSEKTKIEYKFVKLLQDEKLEDKVSFWDYAKSDTLYTRRSGGPE